ncbi:hypothetical protein AX15_004629 [Amanita polypyramis BW_CC]|nr:hypothetical protein AX15_004629 [Amanita polypyramis BW_CC]
MCVLLRIATLLLPASSAVGLATFSSGAQGSVDFYNPTAAGGSMLDSVGGGLGEPLNVIISGKSSPEVLTDSGFLNYAQAIGFSTECLGIHIGDPQTANLGDGSGYLNQTIELREDYDDPVFGTCIESAIGGNHFRMWRQNGPSANSGALFLAASKEQSAAQGHNIVQNGYNKGRDLLAANARGTIKYNGVTYTTTIDRLTGLLTPGSQGVNHGKQRLKQVFDLNFS